MGCEAQRCRQILRILRGNLHDSMKGAVGVVTLVEGSSGEGDAVVSHFGRDDGHLE